MPFSPTDISGLRCWEADALALANNDPVDTWTDAGAAAITLTAALTVRPTYKSAPTGFNSKPAVEFDGVNDMLTSSESPAWGDFTIVVVMKFVTNPSPAFVRIFDKLYDVGTWLGRSESASGGSRDNEITAGVRQAVSPYGQALAGFGAGTYIVTSRRSGTLHGIYKDGCSNSYLKTVSATNTSAAAYTVGGHGSDYANIQIAGLFVAPSAVSDTDLDSLYGYLATKYALTVRKFADPLKTYYRTSFENKINGDIVLRVLDTNDGVTFDGVPCLYTSTSGFCPNPQVKYSNGAFKIAHTSANENVGWVNRPQCATLSFATSTDGKTYTATFDYDLSLTFYQIFAGSWFEDAGVEYYVFTANTAAGGNFTPYYTKPTVAGVYTAWDAPVAITGAGFPASFQDPFMLNKIGSTYYMIANSNTLLFSSASPFSGYTLDTTDNNWSLAAPTGDGPELFKFNASLWRLYQEKTAQDTGLEYAELASAWPSATAWSGPNQITGPQTWPVASGAHPRERAGNLILSPVTLIYQGVFDAMRSGGVIGRMDA